MRNGTCSQRKESGRLTFARGSLSWPTATVRDASPATGMRSVTKTQPNRGVNLNLLAEKRWPSPTAQDSAGRDYTYSRGDSSKPTPMLPGAAKAWATPAASLPNDGEDPSTWLPGSAMLKERHGNGNGAGMPLGIQAKVWATPKAWDGTQGEQKPDGKRGLGLPTEAKKFPTPASLKDSTSSPATTSPIDGTSETCASTPKDSPTSEGEPTTKHWPTPTARDWKDGDPSPRAPTNALLGREAPRWARPDLTMKSDPSSHPCPETGGVA